MFNTRRTRRTHVDYSFKFKVGRGMILGDKQNFTNKNLPALFNISSYDYGTCNLWHQVIIRMRRLVSDEFSSPPVSPEAHICS
jgi:hypothetical protein